MDDLKQTVPDTRNDAAGEVSLLSALVFDRAPMMPRRWTRSDVLVLDVWEGGGTAFEIKWNLGQPVVRTAIALPDVLADKGLNDANNAALLHKTLVSHGVTAKDVILILPEAVIKHTQFTLPKLPRRAFLTVLDQKAHEIEGLQEGEIAWGFHVTERETSNQRDVLVFAAQRATVLRLIRGLACVGLTTVSVMPALATMMRVASGLAAAIDGDAFALVLLERDRARLSLIKDQRLFYDRTARLGEDADGQRTGLMRQVHRALLNYQQHHHEDPVRQLFIADGDLPRAKQLADALVGDLLTPLRLVSPAWLLPGGDRAAEVELANGHVTGALLLLADRGCRDVDMLPSEVRTKKRDRLMFLLVLGVVVLTWCATWWFAQRLQQDLMLARQVANLQKQEVTLLADVPRRHEAMLKMRKRVGSEANEFGIVLPRNVDFGGVFELIASAVSPDLLVTSVRIDGHNDRAARVVGSEGDGPYAMTLQGLCPRKYLESQALVQESIDRLVASPLMASVNPGPLQQAVDAMFGPVTRFEIRGEIAAIAGRTKNQEK